ncbi:MAG: glucan 1,6-alpha-isomaltosidase, partial [Muribaculaceae bacterium]|nr:glucan 1,6-alpha-isomaltosidase [Muribaculaceae bacterium]
HYSDLGIDYIRMDFLSWYEDGKDRNIGVVGHGYGRASYARALSYIAESAKKYGIFTSLVMPHLFNDAEVEGKYGNMVRIVSDTAGGGWWHCSDYDKGKSYTTWPNCMNMFDGFTFWSHISGRNKVILDGDFIRLNKFNTDAEKQTVVSLQLMAGGPVTVADQYYTIGDNTKFYTNTEMLALNADGFVGKPLSDKLNDRNNEIWYGQMSNGDYVVGLFNRSESPRAYSLMLQDLGISGEWNQRDLWEHSDKAPSSKIEATVEPHGCKIIRLSK